MMEKVTAVIAMVGFIAAAGLDSEDWVTPLVVMMVSFGWCAFYGIFIQKGEQ